MYVYNESVYKQAKKAMEKRAKLQELAFCKATSIPEAE